MLDCNITEALYNHVKKSQFGICSNVDTLLSMALNEMRVDLGCSSAVLCYIPETCTGSTTISCSLVTSQTITTTSCVLVATQSFDDP
jgi:hypothetical protein